MSTKTKGKRPARPAEQKARERRQRARLAREQEARRAEAHRKLQLRIGVGLGVALAALVAIFLLAGGNRDSQAANPSGFDYEVGSPGPGEPAPEIELTTATGERFDLSSLRGETVLLYFQEGIGCQPCWDQLTDIEPRMDEFEALGIDRIATITTDPPDLLPQKVADEGIATPVMSDANVTYSRAYGTTEFRMAGMAPSFNGHSFVLVDEQGTIEWRADYGGPTTGNTMYVPVDGLLADIEAAVAAGSA